jgi:hypothetical protein
LVVVVIIHAGVPFVVWKYFVDTDSALEDLVHMKTVQYRRNLHLLPKPFLPCNWSNFPANTYLIRDKPIIVEWHTHFKY